MPVQPSVSLQVAILVLIALFMPGPSPDRTPGQRGMADTVAPGISVVLVTVPSKDAGRTLARHLVGSKLAACVNIVPGERAANLGIVCSKGGP